MSVNMSVSADRAMTVGAPLASSSYVMWVPLMGGLWVVMNVALVYLGLHVPYCLPCSLLAGVVNGMLVSVIAGAKASERFQGGGTGLLRGLNFRCLLNE